jgi:predicted AAA+ superfamily ATPase
MIPRTLAAELRRMLKKFPIVSLTGPRQSGKSTLLRHALPGYAYVSLEEPDNRLFCQTDPRGFLETYAGRTIIDEAQHAPGLFSYLQGRVDEAGREGMYVLAGSQNFLMMQSISQSLAGRVALLRLLPFSHEELHRAGLLRPDVNGQIFHGAYPRLYDKGIEPGKYFPSYIQTYVERDVMLLKNIGDTGRFVRFMKLCAGRIGQLLNMSSLANDCGVSVPTVHAWLSVLEASYIVHLLRPEHGNFSKRLVKTPKLYFHDTGLACSLLEIRSADEVDGHYLRGGLFENLVINRVIRHALNRGEEPAVSFWRDKTGNEVDLLAGPGGRRRAFEIKAGATYSPDYFKGLAVWAGLSGASKEDCTAIYTGSQTLSTSRGRVVPWDKWKVSG